MKRRPVAVFMNHVAYSRYAVTNKFVFCSRPVVVSFYTSSRGYCTTLFSFLMTGILWKAKPGCGQNSERHVLAVCHRKAVRVSVANAQQMLDPGTSLAFACASSQVWSCFGKSRHKYGRGERDAHSKHSDMHVVIRCLAPVAGHSRDPPVLASIRTAWSDAMCQKSDPCASTRFSLSACNSNSNSKHLDQIIFIEQHGDGEHVRRRGLVLAPVTGSAVLAASLHLRCPLNNLLTYSYSWELESTTVQRTPSGNALASRRRSDSDALCLHHGFLAYSTQTSRW
jgi:hypothetical protein